MNVFDLEVKYPSFRVLPVRNVVKARWKKEKAQTKYCFLSGRRLGSTVEKQRDLGFPDSVSLVHFLWRIKRDPQYPAKKNRVLF